MQRDEPHRPPHRQCFRPRVRFAIFYQGFRHMPRGPRARWVDVVKPSRPKKGYFFKTCHVYRNAAGIQYDYKLYNKFGKEVKLQARGWRKTLSFNLSLKRGGQERLDIHRSVLCLPMFWKSFSTMCLQVNASKKLQSSVAVSWVVAGCGD